LRSSASAYLNRTFSTPTNNIKWTWSGWIKRGKISGYQRIIGVGSDASGINQASLYFDTSSQIGFFQGDAAGSTEAYLVTNALYRDPSAWYHISFVYDSANATSSNRLLLYVNGVQVTSFASATYPSSSLASKINVNAVNHAIGVLPLISSNYFDGYLAEVNFIDGQAITPFSFGTTNTTTGVWQPAKYTGTYGTNGFYLNFSDNSAVTTSSNVGIGKDFSGNGNYWTSNNINVTAYSGTPPNNTSYDSMTDVPTLTSATAANYAVWNVLKSPSTYGTITNGNLTTNANTTYELNAISSLSSTTGKFYSEFTVQQANTARPNIGIQAINQYQIYTGANIISSATTVAWCQDGRVYANGSLVGTFATYTTGDIVCIAVDCDNGAIYYNKNNGAWINSGVPTSGASRTGSLYNWTGGTVDYGFYIDDNANGNITNANFGQRPFSFSPPSGYVALNTYNL
jgi:hypothetical protein